MAAVASLTSAAGQRDRRAGPHGTRRAAMIRLLSPAEHFTAAGRRGH